MSQKKISDGGALALAGVVAVTVVAGGGSMVAKNQQYRTIDQAAGDAMGEAYNVRAEPAGSSAQETAVNRMLKAAGVAMQGQWYRGEVGAYLQHAGAGLSEGPAQKKVDAAIQTYMAAYPNQIQVMPQGFNGDPLEGDKKSPMRWDSGKHTYKFTNIGDIGVKAGKNGPT